MKSAPHPFRIGGTAFLLLWFTVPATLQASGPYMYAHFINVGQADATLLEFPCGAILIDAGSQDEQFSSRLNDYLEGFFGRRTDLNRTLDALFITHNHIDHTKALRGVVERFTVERYIDNGQTEGLGTENPRWIRAEASDRRMVIREIHNSEIFGNDNHAGLADTVIDPLECQMCDPEIRILSGRHADNPGWSNSQFRNKNNHSLVIRVDFGESSFLFTGDLEEPAIRTLLDEYADDPGVLDADVYHVGHHGSHNGTTMALLNAVSPEMSVVSAGPWDYGKDGDEMFTTWSYGHPRKAIVELMSSVITSRRTTPKVVRVATAAREFTDLEIRKRMYGTPWEGNVKVRAGLDGRFYVTTRRTWQ